VYGAEFELNYSPDTIEGLALHGVVDWTHARFNQLDNTPCYGGQTIAMGCNQQFDTTTGLYFAQDASGSRFIRAPDWQVNLGFDYELPVGSDIKLIISNNNHYSSKYLTAIGFRPDYFQDGFFKSDLGLTLQGANDRWEVAVIGKNITDRHTTSNCNNTNAAAGLLGGQVTGGTTSGPAGIDEVGCYMDPGRELWLRVTLRPFN
jgi:iron complex outermembrane receptor protein